MSGGTDEEEDEEEDDDAALAPSSCVAVVVVSASAWRSRGRSAPSKRQDEGLTRANTGLRERLPRREQIATVLQHLTMNGHLARVLDAGHDVGHCLAARDVEGERAHRVGWNAPDCADAAAAAATAWIGAAAADEEDADALLKNAPMALADDAEAAAVVVDDAAFRRTAAARPPPPLPSSLPLPSLPLLLGVRYTKSSSSSPFVMPRSESVLLRGRLRPPNCSVMRLPAAASTDCSSMRAMLNTVVACSTVSRTRTRSIGARTWMTMASSSPLLQL
jgi:hypothetical protein